MDRSDEEIARNHGLPWIFVFVDDDAMCDKFWRDILAALAAARADERERCAKLADYTDCYWLGVAIRALTAAESSQP